uniref:Reverse transcriptase domain-containing protein n=1 Tax=Tanacetum cinerariifolium TaxID=118510 RepID=A0A6L2K3B5_TANCI|nr:reverse transcriptase domain-containing protein [Tanacetum cinerariifolium]
MQTRSSSRLVSNPSSNPTPSTNPNLKGRNRRRSKQRIEEFSLDELSTPVVMMADQCTMTQLLQEPTKGYEDAIVVPVITMDNFELNHGLLTLVQNKQFFGHDKEDPHAHIRYFNKITSTLNSDLVGERTPRSIFTWDDLVLKFINQFFPPSKTTNLRNEITNFQQRFDESFCEAWDRFKDLLRACPHHGFSELHQLDTFYNALHSKDQDSLNFTAGGNVLDKMPRECLAVIESKSKVCYSRNKPVVVKVSTNTSSFGISHVVAELKDMVKTLLLDKKSQNQAPATVKAVEESCVTCGGAHSYHNCPTTDGNVYRDNIQEFVSQAFAVNYNQGNTSYRPPMMSNQIQPPGFPPVVENEPEATKDTVHPTKNGSTEDVQPSVVQSKSLILTSKPVNSPIIKHVVSPVSAPRPNQRPSIPYPSRMQDQKLRDKSNKQQEKIFQIFKDLNFNICFVDPLNLVPKKAECLALADLGARINLMPLSMWNKLSLPDLTPTSTFHFSAEFVVVDFDANPRVPLILGRSFLKTGRALIDVFEGKLPLRVGKEAITFNLDQTSRYSANYNDMMAKRIDVIDMACEEYSQEVLGFSNVIASGNPTPYYDPIVSTTSLTLTPFENSDFFLEEVDAFLALKDDPTSPKVDQSYLYSEGDILLLKAFLNDDPSLPPPNQGNYLPEVRKELKICEAKSDKYSIDEPPKVELKDLPPHLKYALLDGDDKLPVIIAKDFSMEEKTALITVLKSHMRAITCKLSDIKGIDPGFCTHKILMEEDFKPAVQHQRRVNPKIHDVIKQEVLNLLGAELIYPIFDSPWPLGNPRTLRTKKGGSTVVENEENELILTRLVTGWRVYDGYLLRYDRKLMQVFMDDFSVFRNSFSTCLSHLENMLKRCEDTNLCLNWEKSHFMVKEGIVLYNKISKNGIEVDKAKVDVIDKLPHPTTIKDSKARLLRWVLLLQEFKFKVIDTKGAENLAVDHLSRLENPHQNVLDPKEINETFPLETLNMVSFRSNSSTPWFADFANYHAGNFVVKGMPSQQKNKFFKDVKHYV